MTTDVLREVGEALHGPRWQSELARDLNISDRTIRRWVARRDTVPAGVAPDLLRLCEARGARLEEIVTQLRAIAGDNT